MSRKFFCVLVAFCFVFLFSPALSARVNIIPTPKQAEVQEGEFRFFEGDGKTIIVIGEKASPMENLAAEYINETLKNDYHLPVLEVKAAAELTSGERKGNLILLGGLEESPLFEGYRRMLEGDSAFLRGRASGQTYIINFLPNRENPGKQVVFLSGRKCLGTLYAAVSFTQLIRKEGDDYLVQPARIRDYPDFEHRWPHATRYDGIEGALYWKMNMAPYSQIFHGFDPERSGSLDRNRYARERGMKPVQGLFGDLALENRKSYPDGETYECIGQGMGWSGFCPSNEELLELRVNRLKRFVERTEPGSLYVHFLDHDTYDRSQSAWNNRCSSCRERWPNDVLEALDGKAGAQAHIFNKFTEAIFSVEKGDGYKALEDCLVWLVSAPYGRWSEPDSIWEKVIEYYVNISKNMNYVANVEFCIREQGPRQDGEKMRVSELAEALRKRGRGHEVMLYFAGGDRRTTHRNWPVRHERSFRWLTSPVLSSSFEGANSVLIQNTTHPAMTAEYMWNTRPVGGYWEAPEDRGEWGRAFASRQRPVLPPEIFGEGQFFDRVYQNIYGEKAGRHIAGGLRPVTFSGEVISPEPSGLVAHRPDPSYAWLERIDGSWLPTDSPELQENWRELFAEISAANRRAIEGINSALKSDDLIPGRKADLEKLLKIYENGQYWAEFARMEAGFYLSRFRGGEEKAGSKLEELKSLLEEAPEGESEFASRRQERILEGDAQLAGFKEEAELFERKIESLEKSAPGIQNEIRNELRAREGYDLQERMKPLGYLRIGVFGGRLLHLLEDENLGFVERLPGLTEEIMNYDVICYDGTGRLTREDATLIRNFISSGRGFFTSRATPYFMVGSTDLTPVSDWLGARGYGNLGGGLSPAFPSVLTQDLGDWFEEVERGSGSAALHRPLTGLPVITYERHSNLIFLLANKYEGGRIIYSAAPELPEDLTYKILLWLGYNRI